MILSQLPFTQMVRVALRIMAVVSQLRSISKQVNQLLKLFLPYYMQDENLDDEDIKFQDDYTELGHRL